jgi:hypothetical protein
VPIGYPAVNGDRFDASSIELQLNTKRYIGIKQVKYKQSLEPGEVRGLSSQVLGYTRGLYKVEGSIQIYREEFQDLAIDLQTLAVGLLEANFLAVVTYSESIPGAATIPAGVVGATTKDTIVGMRFTATDHSIDGGSSDPLVVEMPFVARYLLINSVPALNQLFKVAQVAAS